MEPYIYVGMNCPLRHSIEIDYNPELPKAKALTENLKRQLKSYDQQAL